jgi:hypothetical protein
VGYILEFSSFIPSECNSGVTVFSLCPDRNLSSQGLGDSGQVVDWRGAEKEVGFGDRGEGLGKAYGVWSHCVRFWILMR